VVPQLRAWHERYDPEGLTIIGVHTPEFFWERSTERVAAATRKLGIRYAVVQDNDAAIWARYGVRGWPTTVLIDRHGILLYRHIGEGAYRETEAVIQRLIEEKGQ
jgi:1,2-phenylacetyl-CoA epoxidase catalytic subunit